MEKECGRYGQAARLLPLRWQTAALELSKEQQRLAEELRLRVGQPMTVLLPTGEMALRGGHVTQEDLEQLCDSVTGYSRYAAGETLRQGYLPAPGGFRIGLCGTAVLSEGQVTNLRDFSAATVRISRERPGLSDDLLAKLWRGEGTFPNTLLCAPPGLGKTTLLRDMVRALSDGTAATPPLRVALADERGEIAVMYRGAPQMAVGSHTDVLDGCPKAVAIPMLLRSSNPQVIAVDEITVRQDLEAMGSAANCGVSLLATIHAGSVEELKQKPLFARLLRMGVFSRYVLITVAEDVRHYQVGTL